MGKGIIIYQSKYGATRKYAEWLKEATGFDLAETKKADADMLSGCDTVILCGGIYASGIAGISFLRKNKNALAGKKTAVFCVGASPYDIPLFYGRGAWDEEGMKFVDRTMCRMLQKSVAKKDPSTYEPWMIALMCAVGQKCDWTDRKYLEQLLRYIMEV